MAYHRFSLMVGPKEMVTRGNTDLVADLRRYLKPFNGGILDCGIDHILVGFLYSVSLADFVLKLQNYSWEDPDNVVLTVLINNGRIETCRMSDPSPGWWLCRSDPNEPSPPYRKITVVEE